MKKTLYICVEKDWLFIIMVSSVNAVNTVNNTLNVSKQDDIKKLLKYVNNETLEDKPDTFSSTLKGAMGTATVFTGLPLLNFFRKSKKVSTVVTSAGQKISVKDAMKTMDNKTATAFKNIIHGKDGSFLERISNYIDTATDVRKNYDNLKSAVKSANKATKVVKRGKDATAAIEQATTAADYFVNSKKIDLQKAEKIASEAAEKLSKNPNSKLLKLKADKAAKKVAGLSGAKVGKLGKLKGFLKSSGAGMMLIFSGISEATQEVIPTFKELGAKKGFKQLAKSAVKVVGDTAGFVIGEQTFTAIGSAIGTAICPGIGTAIGGVCGFIGGMLGSFAVGKILKPICGKTERELAKEQTQQEQAKLLETDTASLEELKKAAIVKIEQESTMGNISEDSKIALASLQNLEATNPFNV